MAVVAASTVLTMSDHLARAKALRKEEKAMLKANETLEEKRLRRLAKKEAKERKRKHLLGCEDYTNSDNPFGDANLEATFVWKKKYQKEGRDVDQKEIIRENRRHLEETRKELEMVKQRRLQREQEYEARQEEMAQTQREKEMEHFKIFEKQEDTFHLKQAALRSKIRIREGRAKAIDHLAQYYDMFTDPEEGADIQPKTDEEKADEENYLLSHIPEPYKVLNGLRRIDLEDLVEDIKVYMELEKKRDLSFWWDMLVIVQDELVKLKNFSEKDASHERREGIAAVVAPAVNRMFEGKRPAELAELQVQIEKKINSGQVGIDISFWETILSELKALIARARLLELHHKNMEIRCQKLKIIRPKDEHKPSASHSDDRSLSRHHRDRHRDDRRHRDDDRSRRHDSNDRRRSDRSSKSSSSSKRDPDPRDDRQAQSSTASSSSSKADQSQHDDSEVKPENSDAEKDTEMRIKAESASPDRRSSTVKVGEEMLTHEANDNEEDEVPVGDDEEEEDVAPEIRVMERCKSLYDEGRYSPDLIPLDQIDQRAIALLVPEEDERSMNEMRANLFVRNQITSSSGSLPPLTSAETAFDKEARKGMSQEEVQFSVEEVIRQDKSVAGWADKYKPRKPRYFNRVHTGFEWNKYNQTHYDVDNPPPKIVQGYKFNLFYPDLIDKSTSPKYTITPCKDNPEFAIIRFSAGPPYEDIAFKIVNREWNYSYRSGFRSQFSGGILQLWFHFKRYRYRR